VSSRPGSVTGTNPDRDGVTVPDIDERVLERVRKLLARAEHPSTPAAEAEACSDKAAALMSRYVIDQAMLDARRADAAAPVTRRVVVDPPYAVAKAVLVSDVARAFRVCVAIGNDPITGGRRCTMVGFPADVASAELLITSLLLQASTVMLAESRGRSDVKAYRRAFLMGFAAAVGERLRRVRQDAEHEARRATPGTEIVLADRSAKVEAAFAAQFPRLRTLRTTISNGSGLAAGHRAGADADLSAGRRRVANRRGELSA
jgi:hypothetical protein